MNSLDVTFFLLIAVVALQAFRKGFVKEVVGSVVFLIAFLFALKFTYLLLHDYYGTEKPKATTLLAAYLIVFFTIYWGVSFTGRLVDMALKSIKLGLANSIAGAVFGVVKSLFAISMVIWFIDKTGLFQEMIHSSFFYQNLKDFAPSVIDMISDSIPFLKGILIKIEKSFPLLKDPPDKQAMIFYFNGFIAG